MDKLVAQYEDELWQLIKRMARDNVKLRVIYRLLIESANALELPAYIQDWLKQHAS